MNSTHATSSDLLDSMIQRTTSSLQRIAMKAPYVGQKHRAEQFARRVRFPRFSVGRASLIGESLRPMLAERGLACGRA